MEGMIIVSVLILSKEDGMTRECAINCDHLQTVSKNKIESMILSLPSDKMADVAKAVKFALDI